MGYLSFVAAGKCSIPVNYSAIDQQTIRVVRVSQRNSQHQQQNVEEESINIWFGMDFFCSTPKFIGQAGELAFYRVASDPSILKHPASCHAPTEWGGQRTLRVKHGIFRVLQEQAWNEWWPPTNNRTRSNFGIRACFGLFRLQIFLLKSTSNSIRQYWYLSVFCTSATRPSIAHVCPWTNNVDP